MAIKRPSYLKRQKEQKRVERANQKREERRGRKLVRPDGSSLPLDLESGYEETGEADVSEDRPAE